MAGETGCRFSPPQHQILKIDLSDRAFSIHVLDVLSSTGKILTGVEGTAPFPNPLPRSTQSIMHFLGMRYLSEPRHGEAIPCPVRMGHFREYRRRSDDSFPYDLDQMS